MDQKKKHAAYSHFGDLGIGDELPPRIMGIINVSPESFFKPSVASSADSIKQAAKRMAKEGADIIDIGARSSAPYLLTDIPAEEEIERICRGIQLVREVTDIPISADTQLTSVAKAALGAGANILNDISGFAYDTELADVANAFDGIVLMAHADYTNVLGDPVTVVKQSMRAALQRAKQAGIPMDKIVIDPGIGYFRNRYISWDEWDRQVLSNLREFKDFQVPLLIGLSRKSFIGKALGHQDADERLYGSIGLTSLAVYSGAHIIRTHDVAATRDAARIARWLSGSKMY